MKYLRQGLDKPALRHSVTDGGLISHIRATAEVPPKASITRFASRSKVLSVSMKKIVGLSNSSCNSFGGNNLTWQDRLLSVMEQATINRSELARRCEVSAPTVTDWLNGKTKMINGDHLVCVAEVLRINPVWLMTGRGNKQLFDQRIAERRQKERRLK